MQGTVFLNGKFIAANRAFVPLNTHALHYGTGIFEGIRAYYNQKENALLVFRMEDHYKRMYQSSKLLFLTPEYSIEEVCNITKELLQKNFERTDLYIRPLLYKADSAVGKFNLKELKNGFAIYTLPFGKHIRKAEGIKVNISSWNRIADNAIPPRGKITGTYVNAALAKTESIFAGYDEAIYLDSRGHVVEGSVENIFLVKDGTLSTPPISDDILQGITRDMIMRLAKEELRSPAVERSIDRTELYAADEIFFAGTAVEITPVVEIEGRKVGTGVVGKVTGALQTMYDQIVHGENRKYENFITKVLSPKR